MSSPPRRPNLPPTAPISPRARNPARQPSGSGSNFTPFLTTKDRPTSTPSPDAHQHQNHSQSLDASTSTIKHSSLSPNLGSTPGPSGGTAGLVRRPSSRRSNTTDRSGKSGGSAGGVGLGLGGGLGVGSGGVSPEKGGSRAGSVGGIEGVKSPGELTVFVDKLLADLENKFEVMSQDILVRMDQMADRIDHIEQSISDLISTDLYDQPVPLTTGNTPSPVKGGSGGGRPESSRRGSANALGSIGEGGAGAGREGKKVEDGRGKEGRQAEEGLGDESLLMARPMKGMEEGSPGNSV